MNEGDYSARVGVGGMKVREERKEIGNKSTIQKRKRYRR